MVKRKQFKECLMPKSIKKQVEAMGRKDKEDGRLSFANRQNIKFDWILEEEQPLVKDNNEEPDAPYPNIPAEIPGIIMKGDVVTPVTGAGPSSQQRAQSIEERAAMAARN